MAGTSPVALRAARGFSVHERTTSLGKPGLQSVSAIAGEAKADR